LSLLILSVFQLGVKYDVVHEHWAIGRSDITVICGHIMISVCCVAAERIVWLWS